MRNIMKEFAKKSEQRKKSIQFKIMACTTTAMAVATSMTAMAYKNSETIKGADKIIDILLTIAKYAGIALIVYGIYEVVMSFLQNQPEAKTKGIILALGGAVMIAMPTVLTSFTS